MTELGLTSTAGRRHRASTPDRIVVALLTLSAFLIVFALLAGSVRTTPPVAHARRVIVIRRVYRTTVIDDLPDAAPVPPATESVSGSGALPATASTAPTTRTS